MLSIRGPAEQLQPEKRHPDHVAQSLLLNRIWVRPARKLPRPPEGSSYESDLDWTVEEAGAEY